VTVATPIDTVVNPNDSSQYYTLWTTGRIDAGGGAPPITSGPDWYSRFDPPGVAIWITNWSTGAGWVLDYRGGANALNGATHANISSTVISGIPVTASPRIKQYVDWSWDPAGTGQFYVLDGYGKIWPAGGASAPPRTGTRWGTQQAKKLQMRWTPSKLAITADKYGKLYSDWSATVGAVSSTWGSPKSDALRDFTVMDWATGSGYLLGPDGAMHVFGTRTRPMGWPYTKGGDLARTLSVISSSNPEAFREVWAGGNTYEFVSSTPPTVIAGGVDPVSPAATVTDTTRPDLRFEYSDPQNDSMAEAQVLVFTQAFVSGHSMTDPLVWVNNALVALETTDRNARGFACPVDLPNGSYVEFVRAMDTALQWSPWDDWAWTQNVAAPPTPTTLTATANQAAFTVSLSVSTSAGTADTVRFERSDDSGVTWAPVRGAEAIPRITTTTATDYEPPMGVTRSYRAVTYSINPRVLSAPSNVVTATITKRTEVLTAVNDPTLGGEVYAVDGSADWVRPVVVGIFQAIGTDYPTVLKDGRPKARKATLRLHTQDRASWDRLKTLVESESTLVYRDSFGEVIYCELGNDWDRSQLAAAPLPSELTPLRHYHATSLPLVEVAPPIVAT
jgi:hypothetical protein